jgi:predicted metal-dependent HD superfamily phosphohydrolase
MLSSLYGIFNGKDPEKVYISMAVHLINQFGINITESEVRRRYSEPQRHFHTTNHLNDVLRQIFGTSFQNLEDLVSMVISGVFHDIIYDPKRKDNEERCVELLDDYTDISSIEEKEKVESIIEKSKKIILATKSHDKIHELISVFNDIDCSILDRSFKDLLKWEEQIYKEYEFAGWEQYKERRIKFLRLSIPDHMENEKNLNRLIQHIEQMDKIMKSK